MHQHPTTTCLVGILVSHLATVALWAEDGNSWREVQSFKVPEAKQAAACDAKHFYAIENSIIAKYDRRSGQRLAISTGKAQHLNSALLWQGSLLCAHSNYPNLPEQSEVMSLDLNTMKLSTLQNFGNYGGSLTWVLHKGNAWWCNFAHYGDQNHRTFLAKFDEQWNETERWEYPDELVSQLGKYSLSGGVWLGEELLVTGHDAKEVYRLGIPTSGRKLIYFGKQDAPFTGQGIAMDPISDAAKPTMIGIDRANRKVIFAEFVR